MNKVIVTLLILLLAVSGGLGYFSYAQNQQITTLSGQLVALEQSQSRQINAVNEAITALSGETATRLNALAEQAAQANTRIGSLTGEVAAAQSGISSLQADLSGTREQVRDLENDLQSVSGLSVSVINVNEVYGKVSGASVRISDGERDLGSGFLYDSDGHVVTANHVVEDLNQIYVVFPGGDFSTVTMTATSPESDVAVLSLTNRPSIAAPLMADSSKVKVGDPVLAIGSPFDLEGTATSGIVSQTDRYTDITGGTTTRFIANLIQFDAAANFGNSGCPLFNAQGEVIGMVIARVSPDEGDGIYYAVSANKIKKVAADLIARGSFDYPWIGVNISDLTPQMAQSRGLSSIFGALVQAISPNSPSQSGGVLANDIIVGIDDFIVRNVADLTSYLGENKSPGDEVRIAVLRGGNRLDLTLTVARRP